jgi:hypothetical protein
MDDATRSIDDDDEDAMLELLLQEDLFTRIKERCGQNLLGIQVIHDTADELGLGLADTVIVICDLREGNKRRRTRFELDARVLRGACAAAARQREGLAPKDGDAESIEAWRCARDRAVQRCVGEA